MSILPWKRTPSEPLMIIPEDFDEWLRQTSGTHTSLIEWKRLQPSEMLHTAITTKDKESLLRAFGFCKSLFSKAYNELQHGRYRGAARSYAMAGYSCTDFECIERWKLGAFEDNLARDVFNSNYSKVPWGEERKITEMLPSSAPCQYCGTMLARPQTVQGRCPKCDRILTYAEKERNRIDARTARSMFSNDIKKRREEYKDPLAAYSDRAYCWAPAVKELLSLVQPYL